jgi:CubicO group peptidase (beta-lactamase class C family)
MNKSVRVAFLFVLAALPLAAQSGPDFSAAEQSAREELAKVNIPGALIAIVRGTDVIFSKGFGTANVETRDPPRPDMLFRLGSTTKMLTAMAVVGLPVEGRLCLSAPVGKYITGLPARLSRITAGQLLSHTAGIRATKRSCTGRTMTPLGKGIHAWTDEWLFTEPGRTFSYSNPGYWMAGYLLEVVSGKSYADAMQERIFRPLGMVHTTLRPTMAMTWPLALGHDQAPGNTTGIRTCFQCPGKVVADYAFGFIG